YLMRRCNRNREQDGSTSGSAQIVARGGQRDCPCPRPIRKNARVSVAYTPVIAGIPLGAMTVGDLKGGFDVRPMAAALTGALISGVAMYAIGARAQDRFAMNPAMVGNPGMVGNPAMAYYAAQGYTQPLGQPVAYLTTTPQPYAQPVYYTPAPQVAAPAPQVVQRRVAAPRQTVDRTSESAPAYRTVEAT